MKLFVVMLLVAGGLATSASAFTCATAKFHETDVPASNEQRLLSAVRTCDYVAVERLLGDVSPNFVEEGETPILAAIHVRDLRILRMLLEAGARVELTGSSPAIVEAATTGNVDFVALILQSGGNINSVDDRGTALMVAAAINSKPVVEYLIAHGAVVGYVSSSGITALSEAAFALAVDVIPVLLNAGGDPCSRDTDNLTPYEVLLRSATLKHRDSEPAIKQALGLLRCSAH